MKKLFSILISVLLFVVGLGIMFYPTLSNWAHEKAASSVITDYMEQTSHKTAEQYAAEFAAARAYNATVSGDVTSLMEAKEDAANALKNTDYWHTFDEHSGLIGVIEIPKIKVVEPIYHGTAESVLQKGAGHLEGTALPTGDVGNHTVITGHTGLPSAHLFTDLDQLVVGDHFYVDVLDQVFTYEVAEIFVVLPSETKHLAAQPDKDLVTLVTCTPYGVNSHRLLVQAVRVENSVTTPDETPTVTMPAKTDEPKSEALKHLPQLIGTASVLAIVFCGVVVYFVIHEKRKSKHVIDSTEILTDDETKLKE